MRLLTLNAVLLAGLTAAVLPSWADELPPNVTVDAAASADAAPAAGVVVNAPSAGLPGVAATAGGAITLPDLDPDAYFKGQTGGTFGKDATKVLPANRRVGVAGFRVIFITENSIKAQVRASYFAGTDRSGANARLDVALEGVDNAALQAITDTAYQTFLAQLAAAGREVVPAAELQSFLAQVETSPTSPDAPYTKELTLGHGKQTGVAFAPTGMPLWFSNWDTGWTDKGPFKQHNIRSFATASEQLNAILIAPLIVVDFAQMSGSGNRSGFLARSAEVGATLSMSVNAFSTPLTRAEATRSGIVSKGDDAQVSLQQPFVSEIGFASMQQIEKTDNSAAKSVFDTLGKAMGALNAGGAAKSRSINAAVTNNEAYTEAARDALTRATGGFAVWFQKHPAS